MQGQKTARNWKPIKPQGDTSRHPQSSAHVFIAGLRLLSWLKKWFSFGSEMGAICLGSLFLYDMMGTIKTLRSYRKRDYWLHIGLCQKLPSCWGFLSLTFITLVRLSSSSILFYRGAQKDISIRCPLKWNARFVFNMKVPFIFFLLLFFFN